WGWRDAWFAVGLFMLVVLAPLSALFGRSTPESIGLSVEELKPIEEEPVAAKTTLSAQSLSVALRSAVFWTYTMAMCLFNFAWSAITLFNEDLLVHQGLDRTAYMLVMQVLLAVGLPSNILAGWLATRWPMGRVLAFGMVLFGCSLGL